MCRDRAAWRTRLLLGYGVIAGSGGADNRCWNCAPRLVAPIKALNEETPSFGYRTVAHLLGFNKNTVQRIFQLKGW